LDRLKRSGLVWKREKNKAPGSACFFHYAQNYDQPRRALTVIVKPQKLTTDRYSSNLLNPQLGQKRCKLVSYFYISSDIILLNQAATLVRTIRTSSMTTEIHAAFLGKTDEFYRAWDENWVKVESVDRCSLEGLVKINQITSLIFFNDLSFSKFHTILGESKEERQATLKAVAIHDFPAEGTVLPEQYKRLLEATKVKEQLAHSYILRHIKEGATFGLEQWELNVLESSCKVAGEFDEMCSLWREDVQHNPLNGMAKNLGLVNQYTVILQGETGPEEVSYATRYQKQVTNITEELSRLADKITQGEPSPEQLAMADYFKAYINALGSRDLDNLGNLWREVDRIWLNVKGKVQPIATREYDYYDKNAIRVFPDFRLVIVNEESELIKPVEETRQAMILHLGTEFNGDPAFDATKEAMSKVQIFAEGYDVVFSGSLDFQAAGQSLPNEDVIKRKHGVKVFLSLEVNLARWNLALGLAEKVFPKDVDLFKRVDESFDGIAIDLAGHEIGEPLLDTDDIRNKVGGTVFRLLNEDAATLAITAIMPQRVMAGELKQAALETHAMQLLGVYLRYIDIARGAPHLEPYYKGMGLLGLKRMVDSGFIHFIGGELRVNLKATNKLYELSMRDLKQQVEVANSKGPEKALKYLAPVLEAESIPEVAWLILKIHPEE